MRTSMRPTAACAALIGALVVVMPATAFALDQSMHEAISKDACIAANLPKDFCERVGTEAYNVDHYEGALPEAHAQMPNGGSACRAANATLERVRLLGSDVRTSLIALSTSPSKTLATHIASQLGRSLHTIQDDCAHQGMPNDQHAWASLTDACTGSKTSPDAVPEAASCARSESALVMAAFVRELGTARVATSALDGIDEGWTHWPTRGQTCSYLHGAANWTGEDTRWDNSIVAPWLRDQLTHAITTDDASLGDPCAGGQSIEIQRPNPWADVSVKPKWCLKMTVYCIGKADAPDEPPPWEDENEVAATDAGGCDVGRGGGPGPMGGVICVLGALIWGRFQLRKLTIWNRPKAHGRLGTVSTWETNRPKQGQRP